jgi:hypothetical protein
MGGCRLPGLLWIERAGLWYHVTGRAIYPDNRIGNTIVDCWLKWLAGFGSGCTVLC